MAEYSNIPGGAGAPLSAGGEGAAPRHQLNTKFLLLVVLVAGVLATIVGGLWFRAVKRDPARFEAAGDAAYAGGDYRAALPSYGRALNLVKSDKAKRIALIKKIVDTLGRLPAEKDLEAYNYFQSILALREELATLDPSDNDNMQRLLDDYFQVAVGIGSDSAWEALRTKTSKMVDIAPENPVALKYDGIANVVRMARLTMDIKQRDAVRLRLEAARKALPDDREVALYLAAWHLNEARLRKAQADRKELVRLVDRAKSIMLSYTAAHPNNLGAKLESVRVLLEAGLLLSQPQAAEKPDEWNEALKKAAEAEKQMLAEDHPDLADSMVTILRTSDTSPLVLADGTATTNGNERAVAVLKHVLAAHPDSQEIPYFLARIYRETKRQGEALEMFARAAKERPPVIGPAIQKQRSLQINALHGLIDILLEQHEAEPDAAAQAKILVRIKEYLTECQLLASVSPEMDMLEGRVALAEDKQWEALDKLDASSARTDRKNPDAAYLAGTILSKLGQHAAAAQRYAEVFSVPNAPPELRIKAAKATAEVFIRMMQLDGATSLIHNLNKVLPNNPDVHLLMAEVLMERARAAGPVPTQASQQYLWQALSLAKPWADDGNAAARKRLAEIYIRLGDDAQARNVLRDYVRDNPADTEQLTRLIVLEQRTGLSESAMERIAGLLAKVPSGRAAELVRTAVGTRQGPCWTRLGDLLLIACEPSSIKRELQLAEFARSSGLAGEAEQAFARARAIAPQNPQLLRYRFDTALAAGDTAGAQSVIDQGKAVEMDPTEILMWQARLNLALGDAKASAEVLDEVTRKRPLFSDGWRLLGMARLLQGNPAGAENDFRKALELKPDNFPALEAQFRIFADAKRHSQALKCLLQMLSFHPDDPALLENYLAYLRAYGDKNEALRIRQQLAALMPGNFFNRSVLARLYVESGRLDEAQAELAELAQKNPGNLDNVVTSALLEQARNRPQEGRRKLEEYVAGLGEKAGMEDRLALARFLRSIQAPPEEIQAAYAKVLPLQDPKAMPVTLELAEWQAGRGALADALALYRGFRDKTGGSQAYPAIVDLLMRLNQYDEARKELDLWQKATAPAFDSRQAVASALLFGEHGKTTEAEDVLSAAMKKDPGNASLYLVRAQIFFDDRTKEETQARVKKDLEKAVELNPTLTRPRELLQEWFQREARIDEAVAQLTRLVEMRPASPLYRLQLAQIYIRQDRRAALEQLLAESIREVDMPAWHQMRASLLREKGDLDGAVKELAAAYRGQKQPSPESVVLYAEALVDAKRAPEALEVISKNQGALKDSPILNVIYGRALAAADKGYSAEAAFADALRLASDNDGVMEGVVGQLLRMESPDAVIRRLEQAKKARPTFVLDVALAKLFLQGGRQAEAQKILEAVSESTALPKDDATLRPVVYWLLGSVYQATKQQAKARAAYKALLRLQPNQMAALNNLALLLADEMNLPDEALPLVAKAAANWRINDADRANVLDTLGHVQFLANRLPESILTFERSLALKDNVLTRVHMAEALARQQRLVEARNELQRAQQAAQKEHAEPEVFQKIASLLKSLDLPGSGEEIAAKRTGTFLKEPEFQKKDPAAAPGLSSVPAAPASAEPAAPRRSIFDEPEFLRKERAPAAGTAAPPAPVAPKAGA